MVNSTRVKWFDVSRSYEQISWLDPKRLSRGYKHNSQCSCQFQPDEKTHRFSWDKLWFIIPLALLATWMYHFNRTQMSQLMASIKGQLEKKYDSPTCTMVKHYILHLHHSIIENKKRRRNTSIFKSKSRRETGMPGDEKCTIVKGRKQGIKKPVRSPLI